MNYLSIKELRLSLPKIRRRLQCGERFRLMYRSQPVGDILPLVGKTGANSAGIYELLEQPFGEIRLPARVSAARLIRKDRA